MWGYRLLDRESPGGLAARSGPWTGQVFVKKSTTARTAGNCPRRCDVRIVVVVVPSVQPGSRWTSSPRSRSDLAIVSGKRTTPRPALAARSNTPASSALRQARGQTRASSPVSLRRRQTFELGPALTPAWSASSSGDCGLPCSAGCSFGSNAGRCDERGLSAHQLGRRDAGADDRRWHDHHREHGHPQSSRGTRHSKGGWASRKAPPSSIVYTSLFSGFAPFVVRAGTRNAGGR